MRAEVSTIRTATDAARAATPDTPTGLDPTTVAAVTELLRAAADLSRAQRPIVLHGPESYAPPALAPGTAAYGAHVRIPAPPETPAPPAAGPIGHRPALWGDKVLWFGCALATSGVVGALVATIAGAPWVLVVSAAGVLLCPIGGAAINRAERARERS